MSNHAIRNTITDKTTKSSRGFSLVELLVVLALSTGLLGILFYVFSASKQSYLAQDAMGEMQENARLAMQEIKEDIRMTGYMGEIQEYWNIEESGSQPLPGTISNECFTTGFRWVAPFVSVGSGSTPQIPPKITAANNNYAPYGNCISYEDYLINSDTFSLHYAGPSMISDWNATGASSIILRSNLYNGVVYKGNGVDAPPEPSDWIAAPNTANYPVYAATYYVRKCHVPGEDGTCATSHDDIPTLVRAILQADGSVTTEVVATGVADIQIRFGVDTDATADGYANRYVDPDDSWLGSFQSDSKWPRWSRIRTVRVWLLMRSREKLPGYTSNVVTYALGDHTFSTEAGYRYQLYTSTVAIRNPSGDEDAV